MAMLADMAAGKQVFRIHNDNPDRTACRTISIKSPPLRCGEKTHCVLEKKPSGLRFKEHRTARGIKRMKRIISFLLREHATVFY